MNESDDAHRGTRTDPPVLEELIDDLDDLSADDASAGVRGDVRETKALLGQAHARGFIDSAVRRLDAGDVAEAFVGAVIVASPLLVEDGVFDIAAHLFGFTVAGVPVFLLVNTAFVVLMTYALLEWTGRSTEESHMLLGVVPTRLVMVLAVSFLVAALLMTVWGRVGDWRPASEAIARINVLWTVGSLGAALGDLISDGDDSPAVGADGPATAEESVSVVPDQLDDGALLEAIHEHFDRLQANVDDADARRDLQRVRRGTSHAVATGGLDERISKYTSRDVAEAFVGSIFFAIPFLVEDGVYEVADYFLSFRVGQFPVFFLVNAAFVLFMVGALVYWAGPRDVEVSRPLFGVVPRRLVGISIVSFLTAAALATMWGRVDSWQDPVVAVARVSVVWTVASFGASLGDILPGESSGDDINDDIEELGDRVGDLVD